MAFSSDRSHRHRPRQERVLSALSSLFDDGTSEDASPPGQGDSAEDTADASSPRLTIPPELQSLLPPDLWRKLNRDTPSRGVLLNALERLRSTLYQVSTFLPQFLVQEKMRRPVAGLVTGQVLRGSLLFSDVSGFTALSERLVSLGQQGAEVLTTNMNQYFSRMLEIQAQSGGILIKFAGDAMLVYFPEMAEGEHACWAVRTALRMLSAMNEFERIETPKDPVTLKMKIGVATGEFLASSVGSANRVEFVVLGPTVTNTMAAEGASTGAGQLIVDANTARELPRALAESETGSSKLSPVSAEESYLVTPHKAGFFQVRPSETTKLGDFEITAEKRRARGAMALNASPKALVGQMEVVLGQIHALTPYLASELVTQIVAHSRERSVRSQYRPTTVIFCNFTGPEFLFTAWGGKGASRVTSILSAYFNAMQEVITRYGGIVSRIDPYSKGTKMLVLFGAPVAHEDDPQRAVSAALSMNVELDKLNQNWRRKFERDLPTGTNTLIQHRIGITFGETYAGQVGSLNRREYTVMGDEVNLAARLMGAGEMGQILVNQRVFELVGDYFFLTELPSIRVKGKSKPISIYLVEGPREDTLANRVRQRGPLVGRQAELDEAETILQAALNGAGTYLSLQGPAGSGKSHLADVIIERAQAAGAQALFKSCHSYAADSPYTCWSDFLRMVAGITPNDFLPQTHHTKLHLLLEKLHLPDTYSTPLSILMGLRPDIPDDPTSRRRKHGRSSNSQADGFDFVRRGQTRRRSSQLEVLEQLEEVQSTETGQTFQPVPENIDANQLAEMHEAIGSLLGRLALESPLIVFFEDADWMDPLSRDLLFSLKPQVEQMPVLILLAERGERKPEKEAKPASALDNLTALAQIPTRKDRKSRPDIGHILELNPLSLEGTTALVSQLLVTDLAQVIHNQSNGNPLFISEITYWFQQTRKISADELRNVLQTSNFLQKLFLSRLETLPETQREVARIASVIGNEFRTGELQAIVPQSIDATSLSHHLRALVQARWISLTEAGADARYVYQQSLVREILYNSLPHEQRRNLHAHLAEYLSLPQTRRREVQSRLSAFFDTRPAGNPGEEAERIADHFEQAEMWQQSAKAWLSAANQEQQAGLHARATRSYSCALEMLNQIPADEFTDELDLLKSKILIGQGDMAVLAGDYLAATTSYEAAAACLGEKQLPIALGCKLALVLPTQKRAGEAEKILQNLLEVEGYAENLPPNAVLAWLLARAESPEAGKWILQAQELAAPDTELYALLVDLSGEWLTAHQLYISLKLGVGAALCAIHLGDSLAREGKTDEAISQYNLALSDWETQPTQRRGIALGLYRKAEAVWRSGNKAETRKLLNQAISQLPEDAPSLQPAGHHAIQRVMKHLNTGKMRSWPAWKWEYYEDQFRISVLFQAIDINIKE